MKEIQLTQGKVALVDDDMFDEINQFKWYANKQKNTFYAVRNSKTNGKCCLILMHHEIIGRPSNGFETDHKNGDGLRNLRSNLRHVTSRQNNQNRKNLKKTSKYPGVYWHKQSKKWCVLIRINGKQNYLGLFTDEIKAFEVYSQAVNKIGEKILK